MARYSAASIGVAAGVVSNAGSARTSVVIQNNHATQDLYLGTDTSVTTATGLHLAAGESIRLTHKGIVYGIASGAATDVRVFEESF